MVQEGVKGRGGGLTTQRVDLESLSKIKALNYHLLKSKGVRISQCELIKRAINFAYLREAEFIDYVLSGKAEHKASAFDTLVEVTGKPWFPYGNLVKLD
ncbi:MAG: hypothetical protein V1744_02665 [Candidatus Altiarchaeota archaeon]